MPRRFEELIDEAVRAPADDWDFSWFEGRATEERPPNLAQHVGSGANIELAEWFLDRPGTGAGRHHDRLRALHEHIARHGSFRSTTSCTLFEVRAPSGVGRPEGRIDRGGVHPCS